jgi:death on curing protein
VIFPSLEDLMLMHEVLIRRFGGSTGIRDKDALDAALYRPQSGYYSDPISQAAALFESLAVNHPFVDGNKRIAFAAMDTFLRLNSIKINQSSQAAYREIMNMFEKKQLRHEFIEQWLRKVCESQMER